MKNKCIAFVVFRLPLNTLSNAHLMTISAFDILVVECGKVVRMLLRYNAPFVSSNCLKVRCFEWYFRIRIQNHIYFENTTNVFTHIIKWVKRSQWFLKSVVFFRGVLKNTSRRNTHIIKNDLRPFLLAPTDLDLKLDSCTIFLHKFVIWTSRFDDLMDIEITFSYLKSSLLTVVQWMITTSSWRAIIWDNDSHNTDDIWNQALQSLTCQRLLVSNEQVLSGIIPSHKNAADKISLALKDMSNYNQDEEAKKSEYRRWCRTN